MDVKWPEELHALAAREIEENMARGSEGADALERRVKGERAGNRLLTRVPFPSSIDGAKCGGNCAGHHESAGDGVQQSAVKSQKRASAGKITCIVEVGGDASGD